MNCTYIWNIEHCGDLLLPTPLVLYQLKLPELHCFICTSSDNPPLQEQHTQNKLNSTEKPAIYIFLSDNLKVWYDKRLEKGVRQEWVQVVCRVYLIWGQAQGPQSSIMSIHSLQEASWGQLKDLQLPALTGKTAQNIN